MSSTSTLSLALPGAATPISEVIPLFNQLVEILRTKACDSSIYRNIHALFTVALEAETTADPSKDTAKLVPNDSFWCKGEAAPEGAKLQYLDDEAQQKSFAIAAGEKFSFMKWAIDEEVKRDTESERILRDLGPILVRMEDIARLHICIETSGGELTRDPERTIQYMKDLISSSLESLCTGSGDTTHPEYLSFLQEYRKDEYRYRTLHRSSTEKQGTLQNLRNTVSVIQELGLQNTEDAPFYWKYWEQIFPVLLTTGLGLLSLVIGFIVAYVSTPRHSN